MSFTMLNIKDKFDFFEKKEFMQSQDMFGNELFAQVVLDEYVYGNLNISDMTKQEIFNECIEIYCEQIKQGAINSKFELAQQLTNLENKYIQSDPPLAEFLIHIASCENSSGACMTMAKKFFELEREEIGYFWQRKSMISSVDKVGMKLDLEFDQINKKVKLS